MAVIVDAHWRIVHANPRLEDQLGYAPAEVEGHPFFDLFEVEAREAIETELRNCIEHPDHVGRWKFNKIRKDGVKISVEEAAQVVVGSSGKQILVVCQDQTQLKLAKEEIEHLHLELMLRAEDLEAANRELDNFNHTVAHDLRQPLNVLSMCGQMLEDICGAEISDQCLTLVQEVKKVALRMSELVEALLRFSRLTSVEADLELINFSSLAQEIAQSLKLVHSDRDVEFKIKEDIVAFCDKRLLMAILQNLFDNSLKFTRVRDKAIIQVGVMDLDGVSAYYVCDNGTGFDPDDAEKLFTPFLRLPSAEAYKGLGIGLATVHRIVRRHGGQIWAKGEPDKGACFYFTLSENHSESSNSVH